MVVVRSAKKKSTRRKKASEKSQLAIVGRCLSANARTTDCANRIITYFFPSSRNRNDSKEWLKIEQMNRTYNSLRLLHILYLSSLRHITCFVVSILFFSPLNEKTFFFAVSFPFRFVCLCCYFSLIMRHIVCWRTHTNVIDLAVNKSQEFFFLSFSSFSLFFIGSINIFQSIFTQSNANVSFVGASAKIKSQRCRLH